MISTNEEPLHVLDLPQIYTKPSGTDLIKALALLTLQPRAFDTTAEVVKGPAVQPAGVTRYLTSIIASSLSWLDTEELREAVWDAASARLSERSGRTGKTVSTAVSYALLTSGHSHAGDVARF
jgi:hypothetical protein